MTMTVTTHPLSQAAGLIFDAAAARFGGAAGSAWMFSGHAELGGDSPLQAIKAGRIEDVRRVLLDVKIAM
jgi:hypothetical protein